MRSNDAGKEMTDSRPMVNSGVALSHQFNRSVIPPQLWPTFPMNISLSFFEAADATLGHHRRSMSGTSRMIYFYKSGDTPPLASARTSSFRHPYVATSPLLDHYFTATIFDSHQTRSLQVRRRRGISWPHRPLLRTASNRVHRGAS